MQLYNEGTGCLTRPVATVRFKKALFYKAFNDLKKTSLRMHPIHLEKHSRA